MNESERIKNLEAEVRHLKEEIDRQRKVIEQLKGLVFYLEAGQNDIQT